MGSRALAAMLACLAAIAFLASAAGDDPTTEVLGYRPPQHGGSVVIGLTAEPPILNKHLAIGGVGATWLIHNALNDPWIEIAPDGRQLPILARRAPTFQNGGVRLDRRGRMTVELPIRAQAAWSDGTPVTCDDMRFTWQTLMNPKWNVASRQGWDRITAVRCPGPKLAHVEFDGAYAPYVSILREAPLPAHELRGKDFNTALDEGSSVTTGPFEVERWRHGVDLTLRRNDRWWRAGEERRPYLDRIVFRFVRSDNTLNIQLNTGEIELANRALEAPVAATEAVLRGTRLHVVPGTGFEHLGFNTEHGPASHVDVRRAVAHAVDRGELVQALFGPPVGVLDSTLIPAQAPYYLPAFEQYRPDGERVGRYLERAGYRRGEDDRWMKDGRPLTLRFRSIAGRPLSGRAAQLLQDQLARHGITMTIALEKPEVFFGQTLTRRTFDVAMWSLGIGVDPDQKFYFDCDPATKFVNAYGWCSDQMHEWSVESDRTLVPAARARIVHDMQRRMADQLPALPLYQHYDATAVSPQLRGLQPNPQAGLTWNVDEWWVPQ